MMITFTKWFFTLFSLCLLFHFPSAAQGVVINEVMSANTTTSRDEFDTYADWIELYNTTEEDINLNGYYLTDDADAKQKWQFTQDIILRGKDRIIVWASDKHPASSGLHTNFKIGKEGEPIILSAPDGTLVDELSPAQRGRTSLQYSLIFSGSLLWVLAFFSSRSSYSIPVYIQQFGYYIAVSEQLVQLVH